MEKCVFCEINNNNISCKLIHETDFIKAILDADPINEGHILILPKIHTDNIDEIPISVINEMMMLAQKIVPIYRKIYGANGYSIMQNGGDFCDFGHFHLHLFPRYKEDGFGWTYPSGGPFEYSQSVADKIRSKLK